MKQRSEYIHTAIENTVQSVRNLMWIPTKFITAYYGCNATTGIDIIIPYTEGVPLYPLLCTYCNHRHTEDVRSLWHILKRDI